MKIKWFASALLASALLAGCANEPYSETLKRQWPLPDHGTWVITHVQIGSPASGEPFVVDLMRWEWDAYPMFPAYRPVQTMTATFLIGGHNVRNLLSRRDGKRPLVVKFTRQPGFIDEVTGTEIHIQVMNGIKDLDVLDTVRRTGRVN